MKIGTALHPQEMRSGRCLEDSSSEHSAMAAIAAHLTDDGEVGWDSVLCSATVEARQESFSILGDHSTVSDLEHDQPIALDRHIVFKRTRLIIPGRADNDWFSDLCDGESVTRA